MYLAAVPEVFESVVGDLIAASAVLGVPIVAAITSAIVKRDRREEIEKELRILRQINPDSKLYSTWEARVEMTIGEFAIDRQISAVYAKILRRYLVFAFLTFGSIYFNNFFEQAIPGGLLQFVGPVLWLLWSISLAALAYPLLYVLAKQAHYLGLKVQWAWKSRIETRAEKTLQRSEKLVQAAMGNLDEAGRLMNSRPLKEGDPDQHVYQTAIFYLMAGVPEDVVRGKVDKVGGMGPSKIKKVVDEAVLHFNRWREENEPPDLIYRKRDHGQV